MAQRSIQEKGLQMNGGKMLDVRGLQMKGDKRWTLAYHDTICYVMIINISLPMAKDYQIES